MRIHRSTITHSAITALLAFTLLSCGSDDRSGDATSTDSAGHGSPDGRRSDRGGGDGIYNPEPNEGYQRGGDPRSGSIEDYTPQAKGDPVGTPQTRGIESLNATGVEEIHIEVSDDGYTPATIELKRGATTTLVFHGTGSSACARKVQAPEIGLGESEVPTGGMFTAEVTPKRAGTFTLSCGAGGFTGKIHVAP